jgi:hypothetical protein
MAKLTTHWERQTISVTSATRAAEAAVVLSLMIARIVLLGGLRIATICVSCNVLMAITATTLILYHNVNRVLMTQSTTLLAVRVLEVQPVVLNALICYKMCHSYSTFTKTRVCGNVQAVTCHC